MRFLLLALTLTACSAPDRKEDVLLSAAKPAVEAIETPVQLPAPSYVDKVIIACGAKLSKAKRKILSDQIDDINKRMFEKEEHKKLFYFRICSSLSLTESLSQ